MWRKIVIPLILALVLVILELGVGFKINFLVTAVIFFVYGGYFWESLIFSAAGGMMIDFFSAERFGFFLGLFALTALILNILVHNFFSKKNWVTFIIFSAVGLVIYSLLFLIIEAVVDWDFPKIYSWSAVSGKIYELFSTLLLAVVVYLAFGWLRNYNRRKS